MLHMAGAPKMHMFICMKSPGGAKLELAWQLVPAEPISSGGCNVRACMPANHVTHAARDGMHEPGQTWAYQLRGVAVAPVVVPIHL